MEQSTRYNQVESPLIRSDIMVSPVVIRLACDLINSRSEFQDYNVVDIGAGKCEIANQILTQSELKVIQAVEPSSSIQNEIQFNQNANLVSRNNKLLIPIQKTALEYLESQPNNNFSIIILCMVTLHFNQQELLSVMSSVAQKTKKKGSVIIPDLHSSRFCESEFNVQTTRKITLPTVDDGIDFELEYYPRRFENIINPLIESRFKQETKLTPTIHLIEIEKYPRILDGLIRTETPYQISVLTKV